MLESGLDLTPSKFTQVGFPLFISEASPHHLTMGQDNRGAVKYQK